MVKSSKPPFIQRMQFGEFDVTSIVLDQDEFDENIDTLKEVFIYAANAISKEPERTVQIHIEQIKQAGHLPLCAKGTKTAHLFEKYNVETKHLSMIVRGKGEQVMKQILAEQAEFDKKAEQNDVPG